MISLHVLVEVVLHHFLLHLLESLLLLPPLFLFLLLHLLLRLDIARVLIHVLVNLLKQPVLVVLVELLLLHFSVTVWHEDAVFCWVKLGKSRLSLVSIGGVLRRKGFLLKHAQVLVLLDDLVLDVLPGVSHHQVVELHLGVASSHLFDCLSYLHVTLSLPLLQSGGFVTRNSLFFLVKLVIVIDEELQCFLMDS